MSVSKLFQGSDLSRIFAQTRPIVSAGVVAAVIEFLSEKVAPPFETYVDVACGTGFSTVQFAKHFSHTLGTDTASSQIEEAHKLQAFQNRKVDFKVAPASAIPREQTSVDLVTCIQGAHWLDMKEFNTELDRVLRPNGVVALCAYSLPYITVDGIDTARLNGPIKNLQLHRMLLDEGHWNKERRHLEDEYKNIALPNNYEHRLIKNDPKLYLAKEMTLDLFIDYISTWSGYRNYMRENPDANDLDQCHDSIALILGTDCPAAAVVKATFPWFVCMARKP